MARKQLAKKSKRRKRSLTRSFRKAQQQLRERRELTGLSFAFADRLSYLNTEHWDQVCQHGSIFLSRDYLKVIESGGLADVTMRYGIIYRDDTPLGCFATQTMDIRGDQLIRAAQNDKDSSLDVERLKRSALKRAHRRVTVCGNLLSWGLDGFAFRPDQPPKLMWKALSEGLYRLRRADKLYGQTDYVLVKDLPKECEAESRAFGAHVYRALETEPNMVLNLAPNWSTFDDYLASLNKKYRKAARNVYKSLDSDNVVLTRIDDLTEHRDELHNMYKEVSARADVRLATLSVDYFPALHSNLGNDRFATLALRDTDNKLLGFVTVIRDQDTAIGYYLGLDYNANESLPVYHRLLFAVIEQALEWKCRRISFGRTALDAKSRLGCEAEPTFVWVRHRMPLINLVVRQLLKSIPHAEPPERNPFKVEA